MCEKLWDFQVLAARALAEDLLGTNSHEQVLHNF